MVAPHWFPVLLALAPIVCVLVALAARVPALRSALLGLGVAVAGTLWGFPMAPAAVWAALTSMASTLLTVVLILLGGVGLAELMDRSGAQRTLADWLLAASPHRPLMLLLIVYGITPFMESVTGFGLGVVVSVPLLMQFGLPPARAAVAALLGLVLVPWGALAPGTLVAATLGGVPFDALGRLSAWLTLPVLLASNTAVLWLAFGRAAWRYAGLALTTALVLWALLLVASYAVGPPLTGVLGSAGVVAFLLGVAQFKHGAAPEHHVQGPASSVRPSFSAMLRATQPYLLLVGALLASHAVLSLTQAPEAWRVIASPALWLPLTVLISAWRWRARSPAQRDAIQGMFGITLKKWGPIAASTTVFMLLGLLLAVNGMAAALAERAAHLESLFPFIATGLGALGGYITGSNAGAAAMFSAATTLAAKAVGHDALLALAGQNVAGAFAIIVSPPRIALAVGIALGVGASLPAACQRVLALTVVATALLLGWLVAWV